MMLGLLGNPSVKWGQVAVDRLSALGEIAVEPLVFALCSRSAAIRRRAPRALAKIGDQRAVQPLVSLLKDPEAKVRMHAVKRFHSLKVMLS
jgi:HEAT repeat protein